MRKIMLSIFICLISISNNAPAFAGGGHDHGDHGHGHGHSHNEHEEEPRKGPHGGKLLVKDNFALELTIFEKGVPPQFRVYPFLEDKPIKSSDVSAKIRLTRFGDKRTDFPLTPVDEYLTSSQTVVEPHSFAITVNAQYKGVEYSWSYESHEGRTELSHDAMAIAKIEIDKAGPIEISSLTRVYGRLLPNENKVAHVVPRFPGVVREIRKELGDKVAKGEVLAVIESNQSLQPYEVRSQVEGIVTKRHATLGEFISDSREIFIVADLSEVWADFQVYRDDFKQIKVGEKIIIDLGDEKEIQAVVSYVSPMTDIATQSKLVRAVLPNPSGDLRPGLFISGIISSASNMVALSVKREAIQTFRDWKVVFLTDGHIFQAMPVELGRQDSKYVEILSGIEQGDSYVSRNSYIIKADIEKSGASHDH